MTTTSTTVDHGITIEQTEQSYALGSLACDPTLWPRVPRVLAVRVPVGCTARRRDDRTNQHSEGSLACDGSLAKETQGQRTALSHASDKSEEDRLPRMDQVRFRRMAAARREVESGGPRGCEADRHRGLKPNALPLPRSVRWPGQRTLSGGCVHACDLVPRVGQDLARIGEVDHRARDLAASCGDELPRLDQHTLI